MQKFFYCLCLICGIFLTWKNGESTRHFQGWSQKGYDHFKELYKLVKEDCAKPSRNKFEESLQESCVQDYAQRPKYKKVLSFVEDGGEEYLPHEMETVGNRAELYGSEDSSDNDEECDEDGGGGSDDKDHCLSEIG